MSEPPNDPSESRVRGQDPSKSLFTKHDEPAFPPSDDVVTRWLTFEQRKTSEHVAKTEFAHFFALVRVDASQRTGKHDEKSIRGLAHLNDTSFVLHFEDPELASDRFALSVSEGREEEIRSNLSIDQARAQET